MLEIFATTTPIFLLIGIGYLAVMTRLLSKDQVQSLGGFVISFALPALIIRALIQKPIGEVFNPVYLAAYGLGSGGLFAAVFAFARLRGKPLGESGLFALGTSTANSGFIGYPIAAMAVGPTAAIAMALNMVVENLLLIPTALALAEAGRQKGGSFWSALRKTLRRLTRNPILIAIFTGLIIAVSGIDLPEPLFKTIDMLATAAGPTALFVVGGSLYGLQVRGMLSEVGQVVFAKLLLHPLAVFLMLLWLPPLDPALATAAIVIASVPMLSVYPILGQRYGHGELCTASLMLATLLSFVTVSTLLWFIEAHRLPLL
ncbi:AEC family transporter [Modicisalibacter radicis]|uniref:AEC family transporter n=1 Tax=Halomonas sp. EAR18 TaxID=2518972 RepID=UPI00109CA00F|nr:AEC family transporter [Halomonas sp. EAR18]